MKFYLLALLAAFLGLSAPAVAYDHYATSSNAEYCREYTENVTIGNRAEQAYGTACLQPDGSWKKVTTPRLENSRVIVSHPQPEVIIEERHVYHRNPFPLFRAVFGGHGHQYSRTHRRHGGHFRSHRSHRQFGHSRSKKKRKHRKHASGHYSKYASYE